MPDDVPPARARFRPVGWATPLVEGTLGVVAAAASATGSALRRRRVFHPEGVAFDATLQVTGASHGARLLDEAGTHQAIVRLSRGIGLPERWPDFLGIALRLPEVHGPRAHQDLLLVSSGSGALARHLLAPQRTFGPGRWSTLVPYRVAGRPVVFGARRLDDAAPAEVDVDDLRTDPVPLRFALELAGAWGDWEQVGVLELGERLPDAVGDALRFDPAHTGGGIEAAGVVQAVRRFAYRASQAARPDT